MAYKKRGFRQRKLAFRPKKNKQWHIRHLDLASNQVGRTEITAYVVPFGPRPVDKHRLVSTVYRGQGAGYETKVFEDRTGGVVSAPWTEVDGVTYQTLEGAAEGHGHMVRKWAERP